MKSLDIILGKKPSILYPAHGPLVTDPNTHLTMYISHRLMREKQILAALDANKSKPLTQLNIVNSVYKVSVYISTILMK